MIDICPHRWEGGEDEIHQSIEIRPWLRLVCKSIIVDYDLHVYCKGLNNGLSAKQSKGTYQT